MADRYKAECRKFLSDQGCTVTISGSIDKVIDLVAPRQNTSCHKDDEEAGINGWIRGNAKAADD